MAFCDKRIVIIGGAGFLAPYVVAEPRFRITVRGRGD